MLLNSVHTESRSKINVINVSGMRQRKLTLSGKVLNSIKKGTYSNFILIPSFYSKFSSIFSKEICKKL